MASASKVSVLTQIHNSLGRVSGSGRFRILNTCHLLAVQTLSQFSGGPPGGPVTAPPVLHQTRFDPENLSMCP